jgi:hypothetical protein
MISMAQGFGYKDIPALVLPVHWTVQMEDNRPKRFCASATLSALFVPLFQIFSYTFISFTTVRWEIVRSVSAFNNDVSATAVGVAQSV